MASRWLSLTEAARVAQTEFRRVGKTVSRKTVSRWARDGKVNAERRDERWYVDPDSLRRFVARELTQDESMSGNASDGDLNMDDTHIAELRIFLRQRRDSFLTDLHNGVD